MPKKIEVKVKFVVTIKNVFNLEEDSEGKEVWISWKRGKKSQNKGDTKKATVNSSRIAVIGENFTIQSTLFQDEKTKKFESKKLELNVKQVRHPHRRIDFSNSTTTCYEKMEGR